MERSPVLPPSLLLQPPLEAKTQASRVNPPGHRNEPQTVEEGVAAFEAILIFQLLQIMRKTVPRSGLFGTGFVHDLYTSLFDQEVAQQMAQRGGLGLAPLLLRQLQQPAPAPVTSPPQQALATYRSQMETPTPAFTLPIQGVISSPFGWRLDPLDPQREQYHQGIDLAAPEGTVIRAAASGTVIFSGRKEGYGNLVILQHGDGYQTYYAHNAENLVRVGETVQQGQPIGIVGQTGRTTGPHLHFEIRQDARVLDPALFLFQARALQKSPSQKST
ncbi:MAG: hypothetical protein D6736_06095 [Nitrospinota bacterium]|nr:MAG: hypothetical protein D6736_06095 [Nitrospinota bacterium]